MIDYYLITKPGILLGNLITLAVGFILASRGNFDLLLFIETLVGLGLIMASACVFNNYIDREIDQKMERTRQRALVTGAISSQSALAFATGLGLLGAAELLYFTNPLAFCVAAFGFFVYVVLYSFGKSKTIFATAIGSIAGAVPPVVGYCAVTHTFDQGALLLFALLVLWQMPHFFAIALFRYRDYAAASLPLLPIKKGPLITKIHMLIYIALFTGSALLFTVFNYTGMLYAAVALSLGISWFGLCLWGFVMKNDFLWARRMFIYSLMVIFALSMTIALDQTLLS